MRFYFVNIYSFSKFFHRRKKAPLAWTHGFQAMLQQRAWDHKNQTIWSFFFFVFLLSLVIYKAGSIRHTVKHTHIPWKNKTNTKFVVIKINSSYLFFDLTIWECAVLCFRGRVCAFVRAIKREWERGKLFMCAHYVNTHCFLFLEIEIFSLCEFGCFFLSLFLLVNLFM